MSIVEACQRSELDGLRAVRDKLAADLEVSEASYAAQIAARLESVLKRITELGGSQEVTLDDALAERRKQRATKQSKRSG